MTSKKTTLTGIISIIVAVLAPLAAHLQNNAAYAIYGLMLAAGLNAVGNIFSRDNDTSDQEAGVRPEPTKPNGFDPTSR